MHWRTTTAESFTSGSRTVRLVRALVLPNWGGGCCTMRRPSPVFQRSSRLKTGCLLVGCTAFYMFAHPLHLCTLSAHAPLLPFTVSCCCAYLSPCPAFAIGRPGRPS